MTKDNLEEGYIWRITSHVEFSCPVFVFIASWLPLIL